MKRRRQYRRLDHRSSSARFEESQPIVPANLPFDAQPFIELDQVGAAPQQHMLAIVHHFAGAGMLIGRSASAEIRPALKEGHAKAATGKGATSREARQSATDYRNSEILCRMLGHQDKRFRKPFAKTPSFSRTVRLTLPLKTSYSRSAILSSSR